MPSRQRRRRRRKGGKSIAKRALRLARRAWNATDHEVKFKDGNFDDFLIVQPSTFVPAFVNTMSEGVSQDERIGERVALLRLQLRLTFQKNGDNVLPATTVRFMVVWDRQPNGGVPTPANLLENLNISVGNQDANIHAHHNAQTRMRFSYLLDRTLLMNDGHNTSRSVKWTIPLHRRQVQYNGAAGDIANVTSGSLLLCVFGSITNGGNQSVVSGQTRLWFVG